VLYATVSLTFGGCWIMQLRVILKSRGTKGAWNTLCFFFRRSGHANIGTRAKQFTATIPCLLLVLLLFFLSLQFTRGQNAEKDLRTVTLPMHKLWRPYWKLKVQHSIGEGNANLGQGAHLLSHVNLTAKVTSDLISATIPASSPCFLLT